MSVNTDYLSEYVKQWKHSRRDTADAFAGKLSRVQNKVFWADDAEMSRITE